ncbi:hypothetical protein EW146_g2929 [Bondarzewia mesenterica]|uniref:DDB1- and CUL4-associated factor 13 n=1 Tax=Bondarzewia mesenterica TaxID=1095465 RepID=A0A4S4LZ65_9AGAM|nr:hypothetical protein EW146_g2929 [Bondarzewia mesenterica]
MVKISVLQHAPSTHLPARPGDPTPVQRNLDPLLHPFSRARERTRALNATKMERMFAKPFIASLEGHVDAVEVMARKPDSVTDVASASWDGEIILHNLATRTRLAKIPGAHKGKISGLCFSGQTRMLSCGVDHNIKMWDIRPSGDDSMGAGPSEPKPLYVYPGKSVFKSAPVSNLTFPTSTETITAVRFNAAEPSVLASIGTDRTFALYDIRTGKAERRLIMQMRNNSLSWSPTFPTSVLLASEDHNLVLSTLFTADARFVLSGSDDGNIRIWKANASEKLGIITARERAAIEYRDSLKERWKMDAQIGKVQRSRHIPKPVYKAGQLKHTMLEAQRVKEERRRKHTRAGENKPKAERKKVVIAEQT